MVFLLGVGANYGNFEKIYFFSHELILRNITIWGELISYIS